MARTATGQAQPQGARPKGTRPKGTGSNGTGRKGTGPKGTGRNGTGSNGTGPREAGAAGGDPAGVTTPGARPRLAARVRSSSGGQGAGRLRAGQLLTGAARLARHAGSAARQHWLMTALMTAGLALRVISQIAYRPALLYIDSLKYLYNAWPGTDPLGYKGVLQAILLAGNLQLVVAVQHLVGLAMGVAIYVLLLRRGVPRWLAALAAAPVLLDAYELQMEQTIMPDVWFEALMVAGLVALLWQPRLTFRAITVGGAALGLSATVWQGGEFLILPAVVFPLIACAGWRRKIRAAGLMCVAFVVPILLYMTGSLVFSGHFWLSRSGTSSIYGRVAEAADCATLNVPSYERVLCPTASEKALGPDGLDHATSSPLTNYEPPTGLSQSGVVSSFTWSVITQQPLRVLSSISKDAAQLFEVTRVTGPGDTPITRWQFQTYYPGYQNYIRTNPDNVIILGLKVQNPPPDFVYQPLNPSMGGKATVIGPLARFLHAYQLDGGYTPGPLYLFATVVGLAGTLLLVRRRRRNQRDEPDGQSRHQLQLACCLFFITPVALLAICDIPEFSWRYQLPAVVSLPVAGALGIAAIAAEIRGRAARRTTDTGTGGLVTATPAGGTAQTG